MKDKNYQNTLTGFIIFCLILLPISCFINVYVAQQLYNYFLLQIVGVPISWWHMFGILICIGYATVRYREVKFDELSKYLDNKELDKRCARVLTKTILPLGVWLIGYIVYCFV